VSDAAESGAGAAAGVEEEFKFRLSASAWASWPAAWNLPEGMTLAPGREWQAEDLYLDTRAWDLLRRGLSCRLRMTAGAVKLTLKSLGRVTDGALHHRAEHEASLDARATLDPDSWPADLREALAVALGDGISLGELRVLAGLGHHRRSWAVVGDRSFESHESHRTYGTHRTYRTHETHETNNDDPHNASPQPETEPDDGRVTEPPAPLAELALDQAWVRGPRRRGRLAGLGQPAATLSELELERLSADEGAWAALGESLGRAKGLKPLASSKLERALAAISVQRPDGLPGARGLVAGMPLGEAARLALREQLPALALTEARVRLERGEDAVHQMRVAARRVGGIIRLFAPALPDAARHGRAWKDLRRLRRQLGAVRDRDVALLQLDAWCAAASRDDAAGAAALRPLWEADREAALVRLLERLDDAAQQRLFERLLRWSGPDRGPRHGDPAGGDGKAEPSLRAAAPALVEERLKVLLAHAAPLRERDLADREGVPVEDLHAMRIAGKALRDGLRPLKPLLSPGGRAALKELEAVVDTLGRLQDAVIADGLVVAASLPAEDVAAYRAGLADVEDAVRAELPAVLAPVTATDYGARLHEAWA